MNKEVKTSDAPYIVHENEEVKTVNVPYFAIEAAGALQKLYFKRLWILILVLVVLLVATNGAWIWYESQYVDEITETVETYAEGGGNAYGTIVSGYNSEVNYGENESNANKN